jgi:O-antigen/teichoic acid export membrane protein
VSEPTPTTRDEAPVLEAIVEAENPVLQARRERLAAKGDGSLRTHAASGMMVNALFSIGLQGLAFARGFLVAIFLVPSDYGVWAIIVISYTALGRLKDVGIVDKYIQQDDPDEEAAFQKAFTLEAILTGSMGLLLVVATPLIALAYRSPQIIAPGLVALLALPGSILQTPIWAYTREMEFKRQRILGSVDPVMGVVVTVIGAVSGWGYWSFVAGSVAGAWAGAIAIVPHSPYKLRFRYDRGTTRKYMRFSTPILLSNLSNSILLQGTTLFARSAVGLAGIGAMSLSNSIRLYTEFADGIISSTMYPAVCAVKDRRDLLFESFVKSNRLALMWGVPLGIGAALFAGDLLTYVLGHKWVYATILFQSVGVVSAIGHIAFNWDDYVRALGDTKPIAKYAWIGLAGWGIGPIPLMLVDGLRGYSIGLFVVALVTLASRGYFVRKLFSGFAITRHLVRALVPTVPAVAAVLGVRLLESGPRTGLMAVGELVLYLGVTALTTWFAEKALLREATGYLRGARAAAARAAT